jgi:hypothetical protein
MSKYSGHIQSVLPGTGGYGTGTNSLRINKFDFGVGWRDYGQTTNTNYWSVVDPTSSGAYPNTLVGPVVYQYKAAQGPSIISFSSAGNTGSNSPFMLFTRAISGQTAGQMPDYRKATDWYLGNTGTALVTNEFKSLPKIEDVIFAFDVDQVMSVPPATGNINFVADVSRDISQYANTLQQTLGGGGGNARYQGFGQSPQEALPWHIDWNASAFSSSEFTTVNLGPVFSSNKMTISIWAANTVSPGESYTIFQYIESGINITVSYIYDPGPPPLNPVIHIGYNSGSGGGTIEYEVDTSWHNITITRNSNNITIYEDGLNLASASNFGTDNFVGGGTMVIGDSLVQGYGLSLNSVYMWKDDLSSYTVPGTPYNGVDFFYQGSKASFGY